VQSCAKVKKRRRDKTGSDSDKKITESRPKRHDPLFSPILPQVATPASQFSLLTFVVF
jgi:hypothetical protein